MAFLWDTAERSPGNRYSGKERHQVHPWCPHHLLLQDQPFTQDNLLPEMHFGPDPAPRLPWQQHNNISDLLENIFCLFLYSIFQHLMLLSGCSFEGQPMYVVVFLFLFSYQLLYLTNTPPLCVCIYLSFLYSHSLHQSNGISKSRLSILTRSLGRCFLPQGPQSEKK